MSRKMLFISSAIALALVVAISAAATMAADAIKARQEAMEGIRDGMMVLGAIAKKEQPFEAGVVEANAAKIAGHLIEAAELFPEGSLEGEVETWAKAEIWSHREHFDEIFESAIEAAVEVQSVADAEAFPPALGKLGTSCKSCHESYRLPKH